MDILATASATIIVVGQAAISPMMPPPVFDAGTVLPISSQLAPFVSVVDATANHSRIERSGSRKAIGGDRGLSDFGSSILSRESATPSVGSPQFLPFSEENEGSVFRDSDYRAPPSHRPFADPPRSGDSALSDRFPRSRRGRTCSFTPRQPYATSPVFGPIPNLWRCEMFGPVPTLSEYLPRGSGRRT